MSSSNHEGHAGAFRELYAAVIREADALGGPEPPDGDAIKHRLLGILARQTADARERLADHEAAELLDAQYVMVAMADEVLLGRTWAGRAAWADRPLEAERPFSSYVAGERIFQRIDEIVAGKVSASAGLVRVYLLALGLGFRGRYRADPASAEPERYRRELVRHLRRVEPTASAPRDALCPDALAGVADKVPRRGLRSMREGLLPLVAVVAAMVIISHALWYARTMAVREQMDRVDEARAELEQRAKQRPRTRAPKGPEVSVR
jgi:type VI secretion system protein ImpK